MKSAKLAETQPLHRGLRLNSPHSESGSEIVEFGLVLIPLMAVVFLIVDIAWVFFAQATLQHAVQMGVRAAITTQTTAAVDLIVRQNALNLLKGQTVSVTCYAPTDLTTGTACSGGNVVEVKVQNVPVSLLGPITGTSFTSVNLAAVSSDIMESAPLGP